MADNLIVTPGVGKTVRTRVNGADEHRQTVTVDVGSGTAEIALTAGQKTMANSVPVVVASDQPQSTLNTLADATKAVQVQTMPHTAGGCSSFLSIDLDESSESVKGSAGQLYGYYFKNRSGAEVHVKLYDQTATVVQASHTPKLVFTLESLAAANLWFTQGVPFTTGIQAAATTGIAHTDTGAPAANDVVVNIWYK